MILLKSLFNFLVYAPSLPLREFELDWLDDSSSRLIVLRLFLLIQPAVQYWGLWSFPFLISRYIPFYLNLLPRYLLWGLFIVFSSRSEFHSRSWSISDWHVCCKIIPIDTHVACERWRRSLVWACIIPRSDANSSLIELFLQMSDQVIVLLNFLLTFLNLSFKFVNFSAFVFWIQSNLIDNLFLSLNLSF